MMKPATMTSSPFMRLNRSALSLAIALALSSAALAQTTPANADEEAPRAKDDAVRLGTITVTGTGDKLGAGQMLNEDAVKGRSTVTKAATEKDRTTGNPYQDRKSTRLNSSHLDLSRMPSSA